MDKENISSSISRKFNNLSYQVLNSKDPILRRVPKHEVLTMCASGKDRTGLAEHDQTSSAIAARLGIEVQDADKQLLQGTLPGKPEEFMQAVLLSAAMVH